MHAQHVSTLEVACSISSESLLPITRRSSVGLHMAALHLRHSAPTHSAKYAGNKTHSLVIMIRYCPTGLQLFSTIIDDCLQTGTALVESNIPDSTVGRTTKQQMEDAYALSFSATRRACHDHNSLVLARCPLPFGSHCPNTQTANTGFGTITPPGNSCTNRAGLTEPSELAFKGDALHEVCSAMWPWALPCIETAQTI